MNIIEVEDLRKQYRSESGAPINALAGVTFQVAAGQIYGLLGPNGAGKSTLVKILTTMTSPTSGRASVCGFDVVKGGLDVRKRIAVVLQQTAVETMLSVQDNLLIFAHMHGMPMAEARKRLKLVIEEFELGDKMRETAQDLSIGTKRRVQVAKIFMLDTPVIFLDESTTGMDPLMKRRVLDRIRAEARNGRTILLTTQVLSEAEQLCDQINIIDKGRTLASGTLTELRRLSEQMFRVSLTFADVDDGLLGLLRALDPVELSVQERTVEMLFRGEESSLLSRLAEISRRTAITNFEVRGADLEEIFVHLLSRPKGEDATAMNPVGNARSGA